MKTNSSLSCYLLNADSFQDNWQNYSDFLGGIIDLLEANY